MAVYRLHQVLCRADLLFKSNSGAVSVCGCCTYRTIWCVWHFVLRYARHSVMLLAVFLTTMKFCTICNISDSHLLTMIWLHRSVGPAQRSWLRRYGCFGDRTLIWDKTGPLALNCDETINWSPTAFIVGFGTPCTHPFCCGDSLKA